jgi:hypothetical protein
MVSFRRNCLSKLILSIYEHKTYNRTKQNRIANIDKRQWVFLEYTM